MSIFTVRVFAHCRASAPNNVIEFINVDNARSLMFELAKKRIPAEVHMHGKSSRMLCVNHPNPYGIRDKAEWEAAQLDGWE
jgi:hypothetical protein